ncbi:MAG TPA: hypothetical protein QGF35_00210 [Dehalococcoidia bacterium]|nr:hypothetical protein [Dehalococcoidia bacterium]
MKLKVLTTGFVSSIVAGAIFVPVAFAANSSSTTLGPVRDQTAFQEAEDGERPHKRGFIFETVAGALGMTADELRAELQSGRTVLEIATESGQVGEVTDAINSGITQRVNDAVTEGRITQEKAEKLLEGLDDKVELILDGSGRPGRGLAGRGFRHGPGCSEQAEGGEGEVDPTTSTDA